MDSIRIVIADDKDTFRSGFRSYLSRQPGMNVVGAVGSGQEAIESVQTLAPDVLVLDIVMPGMDGLDVVRELSGEQTPSRVLVLSIYEDSRFIDALMEHDIVAGYLLKEELPEKIAEAIYRVARGERSIFSPAIAKKAPPASQS